MPKLITIYCSAIGHDAQALRNPVLLEVLHILERTTIITHRAWNGVAHAGFTGMAHYMKNAKTSIRLREYTGYLFPKFSKMVWFAPYKQIGIVFTLNNNIRLREYN